jgi:hypothetical protein
MLKHKLDIFDRGVAKKENRWEYANLNKGPSLACSVHWPSITLTGGLALMKTTYLSDGACPSTALSQFLLS